MTVRSGRQVDGEKFREKIAEKYLSLTAFADAAGVSIRTVANAARGATIRRATATVMAAHLDCDPDDFSTPTTRNTSRVA